jgi:hypothetical protein
MLHLALTITPILSTDKRGFSFCANTLVIIYAILTLGCSTILQRHTTYAAQKPTTSGPAATGQQGATGTSDDVNKSLPATVTAKDGKAKKEKKPKRGAIVVAPLPISSPAIGSGIVPVLGYIFPFSKNDQESPPSTVGVAGLITNNGSRGFVIGGQLFLDHNRYEVTSGYARGNVDYNIYGTGVAENLKLPLNQTGQAFFGRSCAVSAGNSLWARDLSQDAHSLPWCQTMTPASQSPQKSDFIRISRHSEYA